MNATGLGVDIESIARFEQRPYAKFESFYKKIFSAKEIEYCLAKKLPHQHFAVRFCAKEAFIKAWQGKIKSYPAIKVETSNKPVVVYNDKKYLVSLSHDQDKAIAVVLI